MKRKKKKLIKITKLKKKAEMEFHRWICRRDNYVCFTCGKQGNQAGHFRHNRLDFEPKNLACQCIRCNHFMSGNLGVYSVQIDAKYGIGTAERLINDSGMTYKYSRSELEGFYEEYKRLNEVF